MYKRPGSRKRPAETNTTPAALGSGENGHAVPPVPHTDSTTVTPRLSSRVLLDYALKPPTLPSVYFSKRFGEVKIKPPSGHEYFASILYKSGFVLTFPKNYLREDARSFRRNLTHWISEHDDEYSRIENPAQRFMRAVDAFFLSTENLRHSTTTTRNDIETFQPSLLHCLLGVNLLQERLLSAVFRVLNEHRFGSSSWDVDYVNTLLNQVKFLPSLVDGKEFVSKLMEIFEKATVRVQKEIVRFLPEIFPPEIHPLMVPRLMGIFEKGTPTNVAMLDCFYGLAIPQSDCLRIRTEAARLMANAQLEDLQSYFGFLLKVDSPLMELEEGINAMRENLEIIDPLNNHDILPTLVGICEKLRFCVSVNPNVPRIWNSLVKDDLKCDVELKTLDLIMLLVFIEQEDEVARKVLETLFKNIKMINKLFDNMLQRTKKIVAELSKSLVSFLDSLIRQPNSKAHDAAISITKKLFVSIGPTIAFDLSQNLCSVLTTGHPISRDIALKVFTSIAESDPTKVHRFHTLLSTALHYVVKFPAREVEALMKLLAKIAFIPKSHAGGANAFTPEFMTWLRKQISHPDINTRMYGVIGTLSAVNELANQNPSDDELIEELLALALSSTEKEVESLIIVYDKLAELASILPAEICEICRDLLKLKFESKWTSGHLEETVNTSLTLEPQFGLNENSDPSMIVFDSEESPVILPSLIRALLCLEKAVNTEFLEGDVAFLGEPIRFPKMSYYDDLFQLSVEQRDELGKYLVVAINYFRECTSGLAGSNSPEVKAQVWLRISNVVTLQKLLVLNFKSLNTLPLANGGPGISQNSRTTKPRASANVQPKFLLPHLRPFEDSVFQLLTHPVNFNPSVKDGFTLDILELLLTELLQERKITPKFNVNNVLKSCCQHLKSISDWIKVNTIAADQPYLKSCLGLLLTVIDMLITHSSVEPSYICQLASFVCDSPAHVKGHIKLLRTVHNTLPASEALEKPIGDKIKEYLTKDWTLPSRTLDYLLSTWLDTTPSRFELIQNLTESLLSKSSESDDYILNSAVYKTCLQYNFHIWYTALIKSLSQHVLKFGRRREDWESSIDLWRSSINVFGRLVSISSQLNNKIFQSKLLKYSTIFVGAFYSGGLPLLPHLWTRDPGASVVFMEQLQVATRRIQSICDFAKITKNQKLLEFVPCVKKTLETLLFRVRELMVNNGMAKAFLMENLKFRNLEGEEIDSEDFRGTHSAGEDSSGTEEEVDSD